MLSLLSSHRRLAISAGVAAVAIAAGGTAIAVHTSGAPVASTSTTTPLPASGGASTPAGRPLKRIAARRSVVARLVSSTATAVTVSDPSGAQVTYTVTPRTRVTGPGHATESLSSIPTGEVVVVVSNGAQHAGRAPKGQPAAAQTPAAATTRPSTAVSVQDTGFAAR
jgi:hypothetical protein